MQTLIMYIYEYQPSPVLDCSKSVQNKTQGIFGKIYCIMHILYMKEKKSNDIIIDESGTILWYTLHLVEWKKKNLVKAHLSK